MEPREPEWLTYAEAAERLNVSPHAARAKATRMGWRKQMGNDGRARILVALEPRAPDEHPMSTRSSGARKGVDPQLARALEGQVEALKSENATLKDQLAHERTRADRAIAEFSALAERLAALAEERAMPWWQRLLRRA
jgi:hypothetical protein